MSDYIRQRSRSASASGLKTIFRKRDGRFHKGDTKPVEPLLWSEGSRLTAGPFAFLALLTLASCGQGNADPIATRQYASGEIVPQGERFTCTPVKLWDGDGPLWCAEGPRVRLAGIAAREHDGSCRSNQPCPDATTQAARDKLASMLGAVTGTTADGHLLIEGPALSCTSDGSAKGKRTAAWCESQVGGDLSCMMVESGTVLRWDRYWKQHRC